MVLAIDSLLTSADAQKHALTFMHAWDNLVDIMLFDLSSLMITVNGAYRCNLAVRNKHFHRRLSDI